MTAKLLAALVLQTVAGQSPYADPATGDLVARAQARHASLESAVRDYRAVIRTRLDAGVSRGRFARVLGVLAMEQEAEVSWQLPNDVRVVALGQRHRSRSTLVAEADWEWTKPWFIPRFLGDSIRLLDDDFPSRAALHPLADGAERFYRYAIVDSLQLALPGRTVRAVGVEVTPVDPNAALISGALWLDGATGETVRLSFTFVGRTLWAQPEGSTRRDSARAARRNATASQVLRVSADLEYSLWQERYWLPYRQSVTLHVEFPWFKNIVVPVTFLTAFREYRINQGGRIAFSLPLPDTAAGPEAPERDTVRVTVGRGRRRGERPTAEVIPGPRDSGYARAGRWPGGRWEVVVPADSALRGYGGWGDSLALDLSAAGYERLEAVRRDLMTTLDQLPAAFTGRRQFGLAFDQVGDIWRYNRVEGHALSVGVERRVPLPFTSLLARARYGFSDRRLQGWAALRRDAPGSRATLAFLRELRDADPLASGLSPSNSLAALWLAHDDGDYLFVEGAEFIVERALDRRADLRLGLHAGRESAPRGDARSALNDLLGGTGRFPANGPALEGSFVTARAEADGGARPLRWRSGLDLTTGAGRMLARGWADARVQSPLALGLDLTLRARAGLGVGDPIPQRDYRLGGVRSLRGFPYGAFRGSSAWAAGMDVGRSGWLVSPVLYVDAGAASTLPHLARARTEYAAGFGLSMLGGLLRLNAGTPLSRPREWRVDLVIGAQR